MVELIKLARPYARAAFEYAQTAQQLPQWLAYLQQLAILIEQPVVKKLIKNPKYSTEQLIEILMALNDKKLHENEKNFLKILAENHRLIALPEIANLFEQYHAANQRMIDVEVDSVVELDDAFKKELTQRLQKKLNKEVVLHCKIDPKLMGGLIVRAGDLVIDNSVRGQLQRLKEKLVTA